MRYGKHIIVMLGIISFSSLHASGDRFTSDFGSHYALGSHNTYSYSSAIPMPPPPTALPPLPPYPQSSRAGNVFNQQAETRFFPDNYESVRLFPERIQSPYTYYQEDNYYLQTTPYGIREGYYPSRVYDGYYDRGHISDNYIHDPYRFCGSDTNTPGGVYGCSYPTARHDSRSTVPHYTHHGSRSLALPDLTVEQVIIDHASDIVQALVCNRGGELADHHRGWKLSFYYNQSQVRSSYQFGGFESSECKYLQSSPALVGSELGVYPVVRVVVDVDNEIREQNESNNVISDRP